jgi:hypothetical protein
VPKGGSTEGVPWPRVEDATYNSCKGLLGAWLKSLQTGDGQLRQHGVTSVRQDHSADQGKQKGPVAGFAENFPLEQILCKRTEERRRRGSAHWFLTPLGLQKYTVELCPCDVTPEQVTE